MATNENFYKFRAHSELRVVGGAGQAKHAHFTAITLAGMQLKTDAVK